MNPWLEPMNAHGASVFQFISLMCFRPYLLPMMVSCFGTDLVSDHGTWVRKLNAQKTEKLSLLIMNEELALHDMEVTKKIQQKKKRFFCVSSISGRGIIKQSSNDIARRFPTFFLDAPSHLYKRVCPSVRPSVRPYVRGSVR